MTPRHCALVLSAAALLAGGGPLLSGCAPLVVGAVGAGALVAADRRSAGTVVDDESIEIKIANAAMRYGNDVHFNVTSYNGVVLLSGEVPNQETMNDLVNYARTTARVRRVENELQVGPVTGIGSRSDDTLITSTVKTRFLDSSTFSANHVKVVTERRVVYLFGIVTREEAAAATDIAAKTSGVARVVRLFEQM